MNTRTDKVYHLKQTRARDNVIILSDLEFNFKRSQLNRIQELHNNCVHYQDISIEIKRCPYEVMLALIHMVKTGRKIKPIWEVLK